MSSTLFLCVNFVAYSLKLGTDWFAWGLQAGVLTGDNVRKLFEYARENQVSIMQFVSAWMSDWDRWGAVRDSGESSLISIDFIATEGKRVLQAIVSQDLLHRQRVP